MTDNNVEFPDDRSTTPDPLAALGATDVAPPSPPVEERRPKKVKTAAPNVKVIVQQPAEPTPEVAQPIPQAPPPSRPLNFFDVLGAMDSQGTLHVRRIKPEKWRGEFVGKGECGQIPSGTKDILAYIEDSWGGGTYEIRGVGADGKTLKTATLESPKAPKPLTGEDDDDDDETPNVFVPMGGGIPQRQWPGQQPIPGQQPFPPYGYAGGYNPIYGVNPSLAQLPTKEKELEEARTARLKAEQDAALTKVQAQHDKEVAELRAKQEAADQRRNGPDPMESFVKMLQAQTEAQNARWEQERKERMDREERERKDKADREERLERERQRAEERAEKRREDEEKRREQDRKDERERQEKFFAQMQAMNDPQKLISMIAALKSAAGDDLGGIGKFAKVVEIVDTLRGGHEEKSETTQKIEAAKEMVATAAGALGPAVGEIVNMVKASREEQARMRAARVAQMRARVTQVPQQPQRQPAPVPAAVPQQIAQQPAAPQPATEPQPAPTTETVNAGATVEIDGEMARTEPAPAHIPEAPKEAAKDSSEMKWMKLLDFILDAHKNGNPPQLTANALRIFAQGAEATDELSMIVQTELPVLQTQLTMLVGAVDDPPTKARITELKAVVDSPDGRSWLETVIKTIKES